MLAGTATGTLKSRDGAVESIRALRVARNGAIKSHTAAINALRQMITTAPTQLREQLLGLGVKTLVKTCARLRPGDLADPAQGVKAALRRLARRCQMLAAEIAETDRDLSKLVGRNAPDLIAQNGVGTEIAGQLLITAGDNPTRVRSEAPLPRCAASARFQPYQRRPTGTVSTAAVTEQPTALCTGSLSCE